MKIVAAAILVSLTCSVSLAQSAPRVAVVDFAGDENGDLRPVLEQAARRFELVDRAQTRAAVRGAGYRGSLNLRREEAIDLGRSLGCDFYFLGRAHNLRRLGAANDAYYEAMAAVFLVETRSGRLLLFDLATEKSAVESESLARMLATVRLRVSKYIESINATAQLRFAEAVELVTPGEEVIEMLDGEVAPGSLSPPVFFQRVRPTYTTEAALADVAATVEVTAVFGVDGKVSKVELVRWAGFGLDQSALATVRALRFKPAARKGQAIGVRALVRYNFVRPPSAAEREAEAERLRRSLRQLGRP